MTDASDAIAYASAAAQSAASATTQANNAAASAVAASASALTAASTVAAAVGQVTAVVNSAAAYATSAAEFAAEATTQANSAANSAAIVAATAVTAAENAATAEAAAALVSQNTAAADAAAALVSQNAAAGSATTAGNSALAAAGSATTAGNSALAAAGSAASASASIATALASFAPRGWIGGLKLSNDVSLPNTVLDIASGSATSDDNLTYMTLPSAITKSISSAWAVGSGNGGLDTSSPTAGRWYHVFLIERTDTSVVDVLFSLSPTAPTMPTSYTKKRRIGSIFYLVSSQIIPFFQNGDEFLWTSPYLDLSVGSITTALMYQNLSVPTGVEVNALIAISILSSPLGMGVAAFYPNASVGAQCVSCLSTSKPTIVPVNVRTNTSGQIALAATASGSISINTYGYIDTRGRFV